MKAERKKYLASILKSLEKKPDKEQILHISHFAYDFKNHDFLFQHKIIPLFESFLLSHDPKIKELSLGGLCNLSSNPKSHKSLTIELILAQWGQVSVEGQRSIACILYYLNCKPSNLNSSDKVTSNILSSLP